MANNPESRQKKLREGLREFPFQSCFECGHKTADCYYVPLCEIRLNQLLKFLKEQGMVFQYWVECPTRSGDGVFRDLHYEELTLEEGK